MSPADQLATAIMNGMTAAAIGVGILVVGYPVWLATVWIWRNVFWPQTDEEKRPDRHCFMCGRYQPCSGTLCPLRP